MSPRKGLFALYAMATIGSAIATGPGFKAFGWVDLAGYEVITDENSTEVHNLTSCGSKLIVCSAICSKKNGMVAVNNTSTARPCIAFSIKESDDDTLTCKVYADVAFAKSSASGAVKPSEERLYHMPGLKKMLAFKDKRASIDAPGMSWDEIMSDTLKDPSADRYSMLGDMELFRNKGDGNRFTFELRYPEMDSEKAFMWKQLDSPFQGKDQHPFTNVGSTMLHHNQTPSTYDEAIASCANYGAKLVEIWTDEEYSELTKWISTDARYWIGLTDRQKEGTFLWGSGRKLSATIARYWGHEQPNKQGPPGHYSNVDCVVVHGIDGMNDYQCSYKWGFICQKRSEPKLPGTLTLHQAPSTYDEAVQSCASYGAQLVEIQNDEEWFEVKSLLWSK